MRQATSTLEFGIDVSDLDRVLKIDCPPSLAGFLQHLGRQGRRAGIVRNCTFLATKADALIRSAALIRLWKRGIVEPIPKSVERSRATPSGPLPVRLQGECRSLIAPPPGWQRPSTQPAPRHRSRPQKVEAP